MSKLNVLVVGASIAGPTAAYWFAKAGANVTVIERFPGIRPGGQNIDIRTTGVTVMRRMPGLEAAVREKTTEQEGATLVHGDGRPVATMRPTGNPDEQSLISEFEIFRDDLARILYDMTKDDVKYVFGEQIASMQQKDGQPVTVEFTNGFPTSTFDLVVACDGATSRTRAMGFGCSVRDHIVPLNSWGAFFSVDQDLLKGSKMGIGYAAIGGRCMGIGPDPSGGSRVILMAVHPRNQADATLPFRRALKAGNEELKRYVTQYYRDAGWRTDVILDAMNKTKDFYASEFVQVKTPTLYKGRFVLVGDAGYGSGFTGSGTSLAMAGAYVLAGEIASHRGDLDAGLRAYEERMQPMIKDMTKIPPGMPGLLAPQTAWGLWLRNLLLVIVTSITIPSWIRTWFGSSFGGDKYNLPKYEESQ